MIVDLNNEESMRQWIALNPDHNATQVAALRRLWPQFDPHEQVHAGVQQAHPAAELLGGVSTPPPELLQQRQSDLFSG